MGDRPHFFPSKTIPCEILWHLYLSGQAFIGSHLLIYEVSQMKPPPCKQRAHTHTHTHTMHYIFPIRLTLTRI